MVNNKNYTKVEVNVCFSQSRKENSFEKKKIFFAWISQIQSLSRRRNIFIRRKTSNTSKVYQIFKIGYTNSGDYQMID